MLHVAPLEVAAGESPPPCLTGAVLLILILVQVLVPVLVLILLARPPGPTGAVLARPSGLTEPRLKQLI